MADPRAVVRSALYGAGASALLLAPCFWQPHIQAGDLSSHLYNAWLVQFIGRGQAPGLSLARQSNNVLFDLMLSGLMRAGGAAAAEHIAVCITVLVFFWGAFAFVRSSSRTRPRVAPWLLAPVLAMLSYGWVFRMGLFNFYLALGLSFWAMALARYGPWRKAAALLLLGVGFVAHPLPVVWALSVLVYRRAALALAPRRRPRLFIAAVFVLLAAGFVLGLFFETRRDPYQILAVTGADQAWVYGRSYIGVLGALLAVWWLCFRRVVKIRGTARTLLDIRFQLWALNGAAMVLLPTGVLLPGFRSGLDSIAERMSLAGAILFCALLASVRLPKPLIAAMSAVSLVFFAFSYADEKALNRVEAEMGRAAAHVPAGQRLVSALADPQSRIKSLAHMVDRVCIGRCFSYANYEPLTDQFRVRVAGRNRLVVSSFGDSMDIQTGGYVVKARDLPLYRVDLCAPPSPQICVVPLAEGATLRNVGLRVAPALGAE